MNFLDAWARLSPFDYARLMLPVSVLGLAAFLPGRAVARAAAAILALSMLALPELGTGWSMRWAWALLWCAIAWRTGLRAAGGTVSGRSRTGGIESGTVGLLLALALLGLLVAAVARQDLAAVATRGASYGLLLLALGLLHLMLRRDSLRAMLAFGALGLGLQVLSGTARENLLPEVPHDHGSVLLATAVAVALAERLARVREHDAGSALVSDAHDLHD